MMGVSDICRWLSWLGQMLPVSPGTGVAADDARDYRSRASGVFCSLGNTRCF